MSEVNRESMEHLKAALSDRYALRREVGRGGMATVHLADDLRHDRPVALKILHPEISGSLGATRFLREIQVVAHLNHPHILPLLDSGRVEDRLFYVMPFVVGETLRVQLNRQGRLSIDEAIRITAEVADGLAYAHEQGLIHRDIKPENILLSSGHAVIADFGIARALDEANDQRLTNTGFVPGTAAYMSPEQWTGAEQLDARTDQYSLACMFFELVAGEAPFKASGMHGLMARHLQSPPPSLRSVVPKVDKAVDAAVVRAMAKQPAERFDSIRDFAAALKGAVIAAPRAFGADTRGSSLWRRAALPGATMLGAALATFGYNFFNGTAGADTQEIRLVVLPFKHIGSEESAYITDGLTEKLTNSLADIPRIGVIARTSASQYAQTSMKPPEIGAELNVQYVLEGSLQRDMPGLDSGTVTLSAGLYRTSDGRRVGLFDQQIAEDSAFQTMGAIALIVARTLEIDVDQPQRERLAAQPTRNLRAWDLYLRGDEQYNRNWTRAVVDSAIVLYTKATELDAEFALAYAKLARAHAWMNQLRYDLRPERLDAARRAAERALAIDSLLMEAHLGLGFYYYWGLDDFDRAVAAFARAHQLRPSGTGASQALVAMANVQRRQGRFDEAIANYQRARDLDPRSYIVWYNLGETLLFTRQYDSARVQLEQVTQLNRVFPEGYVQRARLAINSRGDVREALAALTELREQVPDSTWRLPVWNMLRIVDPSPEQLPGRLRLRGAAVDTAGYHLVKGNIYEGLERRAEARAHFDSARMILERVLPRMSEQPSIHGWLGITYAAAGRVQEALREGHRAMELLADSTDAFDGPEWRINMARILAMVGQYDSAAATLKPALERPSWISGQSILADPIWVHHRESPAFRALLGGPVAQVAARR